MNKNIRHIILIFFSIFSFSTYGQKDKKIFVGQILSDTLTIENKSHYNSLLKSILKSQSQIELRFTIAPSFDNEVCFIIRFDSSWTVKKIAFDPLSKKYILMPFISQIPIDKFFNNLVLYNIFSIPDQSKIQTQEWTLENNGLSAPGMAVTDGTCYKVEFKVSDMFRSYLYCNPISYFKYYPRNYNLHDMADIVRQFDELENK